MTAVGLFLVFDTQFSILFHFFRPSAVENMKLLDKKDGEERVVHSEE